MTREEAIEAIKAKMDYYESDKRLRAALETLIHELAESEDEKIRKDIIQFILYKAGHLLDRETEHKFIAYLEKRKDLFKDGVGHYFYDGHTTYYIGAPAMEELQPNNEWNKEDENTINIMIAILRENHPNGLFKTNPVNTTCMSAISTDMLIKRIESLRPQPHKEIYQAAKHDLAIKFMNYLDENRPDGKMGLSNGECEDIDKAFKENDWAKIMRYYEKYRPSWKPSEEQMKQLHYALTPGSAFDCDILNELYIQLKKLK